MGYSADAVLNKFLTFILFAAIGGSLAGTVLVWIANISGSGIVLGTVVGTILGLLLAFYFIKGGMSILK